MQFSKTISIFIQIATYILAVALAMFVWSETPQLSDLWRVALADLAATAFVFLTSIIFNNSSMYDPYWSVKPMIIVCGYALLFGLNGVGGFAIFGMMLLYGFRLTSNFYRDWPGLKHEDWRYRDLRVKFPKAYWLVSFLGIHLFPSAMVYLACVPIYFVMKESAQIGVIGVVGICLILTAIIIAFVADEQMRSFRKNASNKAMNMKVGLWKHSRHPNYLGELLTWWGIWLMAMDQNTSLWWTGIGALSITLM
ncbi:MAG: DUF1295 domain-containing protein, partial [Flavobacteriales bacterium]|nr:DUF1295 domain-containing protein [Flavobacteriales bacterium]